MYITLAQFEHIQALAHTLARMGDFTAYANPREYIRTENRLFDACVDAMGLAYVDGFACAEHCAAQIITDALTCALDIVDVEAA